MAVKPSKLPPGWSRMVLMKTWAEPDGDGLLRHEVRRDEATGLTLKATFRVVAPPKDEGSEELTTRREHHG